MLHQAYKQLTRIIIHDIFKPPVASRIYIYAFLASYEAMRFSESEVYPTLAGKLNQFSQVPAPKQGEAYCYPVAGIKAFIAVGKALTLSVDQWEELNVHL